MLNQYPSEDLPSKGFLLYGRHLARQMGFSEEAARLLADSAVCSEYWVMRMC